MKTAKIVFYLLLLSAFFVMPRKASAQHPLDTLYISVDPGASDLWHFSFKHSLYQANYSVSQIVLWIDTSSNGYPDVRFYNTDVEAPVANDKVWNGGVTDNGDSAYWCADLSDYILPGYKDSFFAFSLQPDPYNPNANIDGYPIEIHWFANWATEDAHLDPCSNVSNVSSGSFFVYDLPWQGYVLDTVTATVSTPGCDPLFNFTVHNRSNRGFGAINGMIFQSADQFSGTIRPSDIQLPSGWQVDSATSQRVYCSVNNGSPVNEGQSMGGFIVGLRANPLASSFSFAWQALTGGAVIDADTVWNIPVTVPQCSEDQSSDTVVITNPLKCSFSFDVENFHTTSTQVTSADTVSGLTEFTVSTATPRVTIQSITKPSPNIFPQVKGWGYNISTDQQTVNILTNQQIYSQPGGTSVPWIVTFNNPTDVPFTVQWQTLDYSNVISTGSQAMVCGIAPSPDTAWLVSGQSGCKYELVVKNQHVPTSSIQAVAIQMPAANGTFDTTHGSYAGPAGWVPSFGNGILFKNNNGSAFPYLASDTFYFTASPASPGASWPLKMITYQAETEDSLSSKTITAPGCIPAIVCDTVTEGVNIADCLDTLTVNNRRSSDIDRVVVIPMGGWHIGATAQGVTPWGSTFGPDSAVFTGNEGSGLNAYFFVSFNDGPDTQPFPVLVRTYSGGVECDNTVMMTCASAAVPASTNVQTEPLSITVVPNPLKDRSDISFTLDEFSGVNLTLVDILGRTQETLFGGTLTAGDHTLPLDASTLTPGTYYIRLEAEGQRVTKKIVVEH